MRLSQTPCFIVGHPMNRGEPVAALARFVSWQIRSRLQYEVVVDWIDGAKLAVRREMTGATGNIYYGMHEYVDTLPVERLHHPLRAECLSKNDRQ